MFDLSILTFVRQLCESVCVKPKRSCTLPSFSISNSKNEVVLSLGESLHWAPLYRNWPLRHQSPAEDCRRRVTFWLRYFASDNMQIPARRHEQSQADFIFSLPPFRSFSPLCYTARDAIYYIMASVCSQWLRRRFNKGTSLSVLWAGLSA